MNSLFKVEGARRIAGREHDDHHLPVPRTNQAGKAPSIGPDGAPHHTDRAAPVTMESSHGQVVSIWAARRKIVASSPNCAMICTPTGNPCALQCSDRLAAGWPDALNSDVNPIERFNRASAVPYGWDGYLRASPT